jgi:hypothetical protein
VRVRGMSRRERRFVDGAARHEHHGERPRYATISHRTMPVSLTHTDLPTSGMRFQTWAVRPATVQR